MGRSCLGKGLILKPVSQISGTLRDLDEDRVQDYGYEMWKLICV